MLTTYDPAMATKVRVRRTPLVFGGWEGLLVIKGDVLRITGTNSHDRLDIDCSTVRRCRFNWTNGLWSLRMKDGTRIYLQTSGWLMSARGRPESRAANTAIRQLLAKHGVRRIMI